MTLKPEKLILDRNKLIESIWEYRWWILDNSNAMIITIIQEKQYKRPSGKHVDIQATDIIKAKNKGYSEWRAYIDSSMAYGDEGRPGIPPNSILIFDIELLDIE